MGIAPFEAQESQIGSEGDQETRHERQRKIKTAMAWLQGAMGNQSRPAAEVEAEARAQGIAHSTLAEARKRLHIASQKRGHQWVWVPPKTRKKQSVTQ